MKNIFLPVFIGLIIFSSCKEAPVTFNGKENKSICVPKGKQFQINLSENHPDGQTWTLKSEYDENIIQYIKSNYHGTENGTTDFVFEAIKPGNTSVRLNLIEYSHVKDSIEIEIAVQ